MDEWRKEALSPPTDKSRRGVPPGEVQPFAFTVNSVFAPSLPAIAFDSGGSRTMGVPPGVVAFAFAFAFAIAAAAAAASSGGGVGVRDIEASQGESYV